MTVKISADCQGKSNSGRVISLKAGQEVGYGSVCPDGTTWVTVGLTNYKVPSEFIQYE